MKIYLVWLLGVIIWNFGFLKASPLADVFIAVLLTFITVVAKRVSNNENVS